MFKYLYIYVCVVFINLCLFLLVGNDALDTSSGDSHITSQSATFLKIKEMISDRHSYQILEIVLTIANERKKLKINSGNANTL